jgi:BirA family biotin operon repressor/biotin-[acetyl-CoA-carboxylase] ligase
MSGMIIEFHESLGSTSDLAATRLANTDAAGVVIVADSQNAGRGRFSRTWNSNPRDDLLVSIGLRPTADVAARLAMIAAVATADTATKLTGQTTEVKWPNDIRVGGKKISGILIESQIQDGQFRAVVGIGLNLNLDPSAFPQIADIATSVREITGERVDREVALNELMRRLDLVYTLVSRGGSIHARWKSMLDTLGTQIEFNVHPTKQKVRGVATDVAADGGLIVRTEDGRMVTLDSGEVTSQSIG